MRDWRWRIVWLLLLLLLVVVVVRIMVVRSSVRDLLIRMMIRGERRWWRWPAAAAVLCGVHVRGVLLLLWVGGRRRVIRKHGRISGAVAVVVCCRRRRMRVEEPDGDAVRLLLLLLLRSDSVRVVVGRLLVLWCHPVRDLARRRRHPSSVVEGCKQLLLLLWRRALRIWLTVTEARLLLELP
jgi:hypothetical protein